MPEKIELVELNPPEKSRTYRFPGGESLRYENVLRFCARPSGSHRLELHDGRKVIVPAGFLAIELETEAWSL